MNNHYINERGYLELLQNVLENGEKIKTRNGNTLSIFGSMVTFDNINNFFPLLTTKKVFFRGVVEELLWFLRGSTNAKELQEKGIHIWDSNSSREYLDSVGLVNNELGDLGPIYGRQWRSFNGIDQIKYIIDELKKDNNSRRAVLSAWNPSQLNEMALPPCHMVYNFYKNSKGLSCLMTMRSSDLFLGLPFNIASTALLTMLIAKILNIKAVNIAITSCDSHIYEEHIDAVKIQLERSPNIFPNIIIKSDLDHENLSTEENIQWLENLKFEDFILCDYNCHDGIKAIMK